MNLSCSCFRPLLRLAARQQQLTYFFHRPNSTTALACTPGRCLLAKSQHHRSSLEIKCLTSHFIARSCCQEAYLLLSPSTEHVVTTSSAGSPTSSCGGELGSVLGSIAAKQSCLQAPLSPCKSGSGCCCSKSGSGGESVCGGESGGGGNGESGGGGGESGSGATGARMLGLW